MISIIVAVSDDWGIGKDNELLWHISEDLKRFKTADYRQDNHYGEEDLVFPSKKTLPGRKNIVLTDIPDEIIDGSDNSLFH